MGYSYTISSPPFSPPLPPFRSHTWCIVMLVVKQGTPYMLQCMSITTPEDCTCSNACPQLLQKTAYAPMHVHNYSRRLHMLQCMSTTTPEDCICSNACPQLLQKTAYAPMHVHNYSRRLPQLLQKTAYAPMQVHNYSRRLHMLQCMSTTTPEDCICSNACPQLLQNACPQLLLSQSIETHKKFWNW